MCSPSTPRAASRRATESATAPARSLTRRHRPPGTRWCPAPRAALSSRSSRGPTILRPLASSPPGPPRKVTRRCQDSSSGCAARNPETRRPVALFDQVPEVRATDSALAARARLLLEVARELIAAYESVDVAEGARVLHLARRGHESRHGRAIERRRQADALHSGGGELPHREGLAADADHEVHRFLQRPTYRAHGGGGGKVGSWW